MSLANAYTSSEIKERPIPEDSNTKDDYVQTFPPITKIIVGNYYEYFKQVKEGNLYYLDQTKTAVISCFSIVGVSQNCQKLNKIDGGKMKKWVL